MMQPIAYPMRAAGDNEMKRDNTPGLMELQS